MENALQEQRGMTLWAAYSNFEEKEKKSKGKWADFVMYEQDLMKVEENKIVKMKPTNTYLKGQKVKKRGKRFYPCAYIG
jgi:predicted amidohydrolase YtcJ